jgi:hypothetical protein
LPGTRTPGACASTIPIRAVAPCTVSPDAFLACWTRKEGYGKAVGVGIRYPLDSVELCLDCAEPRFTIADPDEPDRFWQGEQVYPSREFVGTVVCEGRSRKLGYYEFDHEDWD